MATEKKRKSLPARLRHEVWRRYFGVLNVGECCCCHTQITMEHFQCGHIISVANGGADIIGNLRPVCCVCNHSMGTKDLDEYAANLLGALKLTDDEERVVDECCAALEKVRVSTPKKQCQIANRGPLKSPYFNYATEFWYEFAMNDACAIAIQNWCHELFGLDSVRYEISEEKLFAMVQHWCDVARHRANYDEFTNILPYLGQESHTCGSICVYAFTIHTLSTAVEALSEHVAANTTLAFLRDLSQQRTREYYEALTMHCRHAGTIVLQVRMCDVDALFSRWCAHNRLEECGKMFAVAEHYPQSCQPSAHAREIIEVSREALRTELYSR